MSAWILINSYIFSLNLSRDCRPKCPSFDDKMGCICNSCFEEQNFSGNKPVGREMQEMSGHTYMEILISLNHTSLHFNQLFWKLVLVEGWGVLFKTQNNFLCVENLCAAKRRMISFWVCAETWWGTEQGPNRSCQSQAVTLQGLRWGVIAQKTIGSVAGMLSLGWQYVPGDSGISYIYLDFGEWNLHYCIWLEEVSELYGVLL